MHGLHYARKAALVLLDATLLIGLWLFMPHPLADAQGLEPCEQVVADTMENHSKMGHELALVKDIAQGTAYFWSEYGEAWALVFLKPGYGVSGVFTESGVCATDSGETRVIYFGNYRLGKG